jgi:hypothetical protein
MILVVLAVHVGDLHRGFINGGVGSHEVSPLSGKL